MTTYTPQQARIMNGSCNSCDVEKQCGYPYKPTYCFNYRKFKEITSATCEYCDGTGDVHSTDGEWRGRCDCEAGRAAS